MRTLSQRGAGRDAPRTAWETLETSGRQRRTEKPDQEDDIPDTIAPWVCRARAHGTSPRALTATIQLPVSEGVPTQKDGFYPKTQLPLTCKLKDGTVLKSLVKPDHLELLIERPGLRPVRIRLPDEFA
jgi:hypothetical protein